MVRLRRQEIRPKKRKRKSERGKNGGARPGAGRPKGAAGRKSQAIAAEALEKGISPLEVMLSAMRLHYAKAMLDPGEVDYKALDTASDHAAKCAKFCHPALNAITHKGTGPGGSVAIADIFKMVDLDDDELEVLESVFSRIKSRGSSDSNTGGEGSKAS